MPKIQHNVAFDWDRGNIDKNYLKHNISQNEAEQIFLDKKLQVKKDFKHSGAEKRYIGLGATRTDKLLFVAFTFRKELVRIISARIANKNERRLYEEYQEKT